MNINLICFPYAGANKNCYSKYLKYKHDKINLITVEYPGRGSRFSEKLVYDIGILADDAFEQCVKIVGDAPYAIYGHSMGALMGFLVTKKLVKIESSPIHLFLSGRRAPSANCNEDLHKLSRKHLIDRLKEFRGGNEELLECNDVMDIFEPIIKADFEAIASYQYVRSENLKVPMTVLFGDRDSIGFEHVENWQDETEEKVDIKKIEGQHFFIFDNPACIMEIVQETLGLNTN